MAEASEGDTLEKKASYTRVFAKNNRRRRFVGTKSNAGKTTDKLTETGANERRVVRQIPDEILNNPELQDAARQVDNETLDSLNP